MATSNDRHVKGSVNTRSTLSGVVNSKDSLQGSVVTKASVAGNVSIGNYVSVDKSYPLDSRCYFTSLALAKAAAASAGEFKESTTTGYCYGQKLLVDDGVFAKWYIIQRNGTLLEEGASFTTNETLVLENGVLRVNTTNETAANNTLPITSAGVYAQLGNIGALLESI